MAFERGYEKDAGTDIVLEKKKVHLPAFKTTIIELEDSFNPPEGTLSYLVQRTSAAKKGILVSSSPIDPGYTGPIYAICMNTTPYDVEFKPGESFCQLVVFPFKNAPKCMIKKPGQIRGNGAFGSSDKK